LARLLINQTGKQAHYPYRVLRNSWPAAPGRFRLKLIPPAFHIAKDAGRFVFTEILAACWHRKRRAGEGRGHRGGGSPGIFWRRKYGGCADLWPCSRGAGGGAQGTGRIGAVSDESGDPENTLTSPPEDCSVFRRGLLQTVVYRKHVLPAGLTEETGKGRKFSAAAAPQSRGVVRP